MKSAASTKHFFLILSSVALLAACSDNTPEKKNTPEPKKEETVPAIAYSIVSSMPHDTTSFTEGLLVQDGELYESTGATEELPQTRSLFGIVDTKTGKINVKAELDKKEFFGEGIVILKGKIYQITYKNQIGFVYDAKTFKQTGRFGYANTEGWGMTTDGTSIIMSDGTNNLTYIDPTTLKPTKTLAVSNNGYAEDYLNELEFIKGYIYANVWTKDYIVKIDPATGKIVGTIDLSNLVYDARHEYRMAKELNGIAYDAAADKIYITGKLWKKIYELKF